MPLLPRPSSLAMPTRGELNVADFTDLINRYGYDVKWSKFLICPNFNPVQPDHHMTDCTFCDHSGRLFYDPIVTRMFASSFALTPKYSPESRYNRGTVYFTTLPGTRISFRDKIEMVTSQMRYSERVLLTAATTYKLRFPALSVTAAVTNANVSVLPTVTVNPDGTVTFTPLPVGAAFVSLAYDHHPVYTVTDVLHVVRDSRTTQNQVDTATEFNRQVVAQLEFTRDPADPNSDIA